MSEREITRPAAASTDATLRRTAAVLTPIGQIVPGVVDDILDRCEAYRATQRETA